jgi:membrane fusion protein (multidrug efflux system)
MSNTVSGTTKEVEENGPSHDAQPHRSEPPTSRKEGSDGQAPQAKPESLPEPKASHSPLRRWLLIGGGVMGLAVLLWFGVPWVILSMNTISTDDAYVSDYVTFVAPRVSGQVTTVLVEDNNRVRKGDILVELDPEPYQVQVDIAKAAVTNAQADVVAATATTRSNVAKTRSLRFGLQHTIEQVDNQVSLLRANVATLESQKASLALAQSNFDRMASLIKTRAVSQEEYDTAQAALAVAKAQVNQALEGVRETRVSLGLPADPPKDKELAYVPDDLDETFSTVRQAQAQLMESAAQLGVDSSSYDLTPKKMIEQFMARDPLHDINRIYEKIIREAPAVKQSEAKLLEAQRNLEQAQLNLSYCRVVAEIDGVISRRNVNPGTNVLAGQQLMALQSTENLWVDANFKETQLAKLRIGQRVEVYTDMYGERKAFKGRISGFTMGTGSTIALLPAENATGNFVKVVQRLPVRIDLEGFDAAKLPLFIGLSVTPYVYFKEEPTGPHAGEVLQPYSKTAASGPSSDSRVPNAPAGPKT